MQPEIRLGDLLDQEVDVIVNPWNRNIIPWWLLLPQGVSGAIKRRAGVAPFRDLARFGPLPLGHAVLTSAGRLPHRGIIHVAGINMFWRASKQSINDSVVSAMAIVDTSSFASVAFPIIGASTGGFGEEGALAAMMEAFGRLTSNSRVIVVRYQPGA
jgi:O-acetyl-ADP-ribose deacetylase (regulator of RNase III)